MHSVIKSFIVLVVALVAATGAFAQSAYKIKPGDALQVEVLEDPSLNRTTLVLPDGSITFPLVGSIPASGRSIDSVKSSLASALTSNFNKQPTVFISIAALAPPPVAVAAGPVAPPTIDIFVMGEVGNPGKLLATPGLTILQALAEAGGLTAFAAQKRIQLRRADPNTGVMTKYLYNYKGTSNSIKGSTVLIPGDVIVVPERRLFE
jgi:polysaccharide export outer membrane protein